MPAVLQPSINNSDPVALARCCWS